MVDRAIRLLIGLGCKPMTSGVLQVTSGIEALISAGLSTTRPADERDEVGVLLEGPEDTD